MEIAKKTNRLPIKEKEEILNELLGVIDSIVKLDDDTLAITTNKNMIFYNTGHTISVSKGLHLTIGKEVHLNPKIDLLKVYENPSGLEDSIEQSKKEELEKLENTLHCGCNLNKS